jgi:acetyl-CoA carboxylase biotin carboxylase subunit
LDSFEIEGVQTTRGLHQAVLSHEDFRNDLISTRWLETTLLPAMSSSTAREETDG